MPFQIPEDVTVLTTKALREFALNAAAEYESIKDSATEETVTDEQLDQMEQYSDFMLVVDDELTARAERASRFRAQTAEVEEEEPEETGEFAEGDTDGEEVPTPTLAQINAVAPSSETTDAIPAPKMFSFIAAPETGFAAGTELSGWDDVVKAFNVRTRSHVRGAPTQQHQFASIKREFGEFDIFENDSETEQMRKIDLVRDESQADGGSLLAGVGWCSPSETIYTTCNQVTTSGMLKVPEIGARRGGVRHNQGIRWSDIYGTGTGFNILTEEQVIADTVKTCVPVNCPPFVDDRLKVAVLCITGDILQDRSYPEYVKEFIRGAVASQAHNVNRQIIADIVSGSTAVTLTGNQPWTSDGSVVSQLMSALDMAATDIRYNLRLDPDATLEVVFPLWVKQAYRADWLRRNAEDDPNMVDAMVNSMYATRNLSVQYVYDWQDAFSTGASGGTAFGGAVAMVTPPTSITFLMFPAGTWVVARQDVIRLDTIYDSTNITTNKVTELFVEDGFRAMRFCPLSRVYTIGICANGSTGVQRAVTC
jgi:hypothetical protein